MNRFASGSAGRPPARSRLGRAAAVLAVLLAAAGCRTIENRIGLPPLIEYDGSTGEFFLRPLFSTAPDEVRVVWPIFRHRADERGVSCWLLPVMVYRSRLQEGGYDRDFYLVPLIAWGDSPDVGAHFALFPFGGTIKSFFGQDEFTFWLFPLYARLREKERLSQHVLWPFVNWVRGPGQGGGRVLPFWGHYWADTAKGAPKYRRTFVGWPFFTHQRNQLDSPTPAESWALFPFYARSASANVTRTHIMWPFYAHYDDRARKTRSWGASLVPIRFTTGPEESQFDLWPFFGTWRQKERSRWFALWPLVRRETQDDGAIAALRFWAAPFWWTADVERGEDKATLHRRKFWPFFSYEEKDDVAHWEALSLLPWYDATTDAFWGRWLHLARYSRRGAARGFELLWGLYSWEDGPEAEAWRIAGGMFARERDGARVTYRILFIPFTAGG